MAVTGDKIEAMRRIVGWINVGQDAGVITDALIAANATITALKAAITAAANTGEKQAIATKVNQALEWGKAFGSVDAWGETHTYTSIAEFTDAGANFMANSGTYRASLY